MASAYAPGSVAPPAWHPKIDNASRDGAKKKGKSKGGKSALKRGPTALPRNRGTGFEEYYADPPMTPQEALEEKEDVYADDLSFEERIQSCIQRFRSRRRIQASQTPFWNEYLFLGGIDTNPAPLSGQDPRDLKELTPAERRDATANDTVHNTPEAEDRFYNGDRENWSVDFTGVASGFFSISVGRLTGFEPQGVETAISVVENFLRYVLHHDVCPEYEYDIKTALEVCGHAREEFPMLLRLKDCLPGQFNLAAAQMFGVYEENDWSFHAFSKSEVDPKVSLLSSLALLDESEIFSSLCQAEHKVVREFECTAGVVEIHRPTEDMAKRFKSLAIDGTSLGLNPIGKAKFKPATIEDDQEHRAVPTWKGTMTLYFDDTILANMKPGMKMTFQICELDVGLKFVKTLHDVVPTFYTFLPQDMMRGFKTPRVNERPAPSIHDRQDAKGKLSEGDADGENEVAGLEGDCA